MDFSILHTQELNDKYGDEQKVSDLIDRKTKANQYESNPDFPDCEDGLMFLYDHISQTAPARRCVSTGAGKAKLKVTSQDPSMRWGLLRLATSTLRLPRVLRQSLKCDTLVWSKISLQTGLGQSQLWHLLQLDM